MQYKYQGKVTLKNNIKILCCSYKLCYGNNIKNNILAVVLKTVEIKKQIQNNICTIKGINFICNLTQIAILEFIKRHLERSQKTILTPKKHPCDVFFKLENNFTEFFRVKIGEFYLKQNL